MKVVCLTYYLCSYSSFIIPTLHLLGLDLCIRKSSISDQDCQVGRVHDIFSKSMDIVHPHWTLHQEKRSLGYVGSVANLSDSCFPYVLVVLLFGNRDATDNRLDTCRKFWTLKNKCQTSYWDVQVMVNRRSNQ